MIAASLCLFLTAAPTAFDLNAAGMKLYSQKKYAEAKDQFLAALKDEAARATVKEQVALRRTRALAKFNLACTLSLLRKAGQVCEHDAYRATILTFVRESIELDPNRLEKALTDKDLESIRDTVDYQQLLGLSVTREADLSALIAKVSWWSPGVGAFGSLRMLQLKPDGSAVLTLKVMDDDGAPTKKKVLTGKWSLKARTLVLTFSEVIPDVGQKSVELTVSTDGRLQGKWSEFTDSPSECDA